MATWILTLAAASLVVSKLPKTKHSNPFNMSVFVASIYGIPTQKQTKTSPNYVYITIISTNGPSITGCPHGSVNDRDKPSIHWYTSLGFFSLLAICWLKTSSKHQTFLQDRCHPQTTPATRTGWSTTSAAWHLPSLVRIFVGANKKHAKKKSNCLNFKSYVFFGWPPFFWENGRSRPKNNFKPCFPLAAIPSHHLPSPIPWSVLTACIQARKQNSQISESTTWAANSLAGLTPGKRDVSDWNSGSSFSACFHDILSLWFNFGWKIATPEAPKTATVWLLFRTKLTHWCWTDSAHHHDTMTIWNNCFQ